MKNLIHRFTARMTRSVLIPLAFLISSQHAYSQWSTMAGGMDNWVYATTVYKGQLIAGGAFSNAGGVSASHIAAWDGTTWSALGSGMDGDVWTLCVYGNDLIAGGTFINAGGIPCYYIAKWNGSAWSDLEGGTDNYVWSLTVYNSKLIVGGYFVNANIPANYIASWDGTSWGTLGSGMGGSQGQVMAMNVYNGKLTAAGFFTTAGGVSVNHIAQWDGSNWNALGTGIDNIPYALTNYGSNLIVGGLFNSAGGVTCHDIAKWNGTTWDSLGVNSAIGGGLYGYVFTLAVSGNNLYAGGIYSYAGGISNASDIAYWDGGKWNGMDGGMFNNGSTSGVYSLSVYGSKLVASGIFAEAGTAGSGNIAQWDLTTGINNQESLSGLSLSQNYPNPFSSLTSIPYSVKQPGQIVIKVYNILGQAVTSLVNAYKQPGNYNITFDGKDLVNGIYYYEIKSGALTETKKMQLIK